MERKLGRMVSARGGGDRDGPSIKKIARESRRIGIDVRNG